MQGVLTWLFCSCAGAALELSTIMAPHAFLPLACSANLAKNLAAVAASSTRAPIYRTFALQNNLVGSAHALDRQPHALLLNTPASTGSGMALLCSLFCAWRSRMHQQYVC